MHRPCVVLNAQLSSLPLEPLKAVALVIKACTARATLPWSKQACNVFQMVHDEEELYSVKSMAELLFGNTNAVSCYASHRLLSQERLYFKQAGRNPPLFQARAPRDVHALRVKQDLEEKVCLNLLVPTPGPCYKVRAHTQAGRSPAKPGHSTALHW